MRKLNRKFWLNVLFLSLSFPAAAYAGVAADTLRTVGLPLVQCMVVAAFGAILSYITSAFGQGQVSSMLKLTTVFICISIVVGVVWKALSSIAGFFGLSL
jgi:hypothetical protein